MSGRLDDLPQPRSWRTRDVGAQCLSGCTMVMEIDLSGDVVEIDQVDDDEFLGLVEDSELQDREAGRRKLRFAREWAQRHIVTDQMVAAHWSDADLRDVEQTIGGEGTPMVAAGCVEAFATALGVGTRTAMQLLSDALDLYYRLPRLWALMDVLQVAPWRARRIAAATHGLSPKAAAYVEAKLRQGRGLVRAGQARQAGHRGRGDVRPGRAGRGRGRRPRPPGGCAWTTTRASSGPAPPAWRSSATPRPCTASWTCSRPAPTTSSTRPGPLPSSRAWTTARSRHSTP